MGGVGSILVLLSFVPSVGFVLGIVGLVLVLIAVKQISDAMNDREIFNNVLMAVIIPWVAVGINLAVGLGLVMYAVPTIAKVDGDYLAEGGYSGTDVVLPPLPTFLDLPIITLMMVFGTWAALIVSAWFLKKGYERIAVRTGTKTFRTVGRLYFYGALLIIVLIGAILAFIAAILQIKAFFSLSESPPSQPTIQVQTI
jgi:uncharacterized membrane protein